MSRRAVSSSRLLSQGSPGTEPHIQPGTQPGGDATPAAVHAAVREKRRPRESTRQSKGEAKGEAKRQRRQRSDRVMPSMPPSDDPPGAPEDARGAVDPVDPLDASADAPSTRSLREWRIAQGMTQQQVAFASGLGITTVRDIERERRTPSIITARKLVRALGITLEQVRWPGEP